MGREKAPGNHSEHNLPGGELQREMKIFGDRGLKSIRWGAF